MNSAEIRKEDELPASLPDSGPKAQSTPKTPPRQSGNKQTPGLNGGRKMGGQVVGALPFRHGNQPPSKGSKTLYIALAAVSLLLIGAYVVYTSTASKKWMVFPVSASEESLVNRPVVAEEPAPKKVTPPPKPAVRQAVPNAVITVPSVGMRNKPSIKSKVMPGSLKRGERVEVVLRHSGGGPSWVKIKTKSGKSGWVFASVVREEKRG